MEIIRRAPLSDGQKGMYLECMEDESSLQYNITEELTFDTSIDVAKLLEAIKTVFAHYAAFTTGVQVIAGVPEIVQYAGAVVDVMYIEGTVEEYKQYRASFTHPFVFDGSPMCEAAVYKTSEAIYLLLGIHHLVFDGTSMTLFNHALEVAYQGKQLPEETVTIFDAVTAEHEHASDPHVAESFDFFEQLLGDADVDSNLLPDVAGEENNKCAVLTYGFDVPGPEVTQFAKRIGVTENVVFLAGFAYALAKYTGQKESLFTSVNNGRYHKPLDNTMGFFVHTFPLRFTIDEETPVADYILSVKNSYINVMKHDDASFADLAAKYGIRSDIKYVYQGNILSDFVFDNHRVGLEFLESDDAQSNLDVMILNDGENFSLRIDYRTSLYSEENIRQFMHLYAQVVCEMLCVQRLCDMRLVQSKDEAFYDAFNATEYPCDASQTAWDILSQQIRERATHPAICFKDCTITYAEFDNLTARLAAYIASKNIGRDDFVAVLISRNQYMAVTAWGVVRAGAAYQPLDPTYPKDRLSYMVEDSGTKLLIADRSLVSLLPDYHCDILFTDEIADLPLPSASPTQETDAEATNFSAFVPRDTPDAALIIVYTSGTTGKPKGCVLENHNIVNFCCQHTQTMSLTSETRFATYASFGFDAAMMDIFSTLMAGGTLYVVPDEIRLDIMQVNDFYCENNITQGFITTQVGRMFAQATTCKTLQALMVGGEKLVPFDPPKNFRLINGYGPSETTAYVCNHVMTDSSIIQPIGLPGFNTKFYIVDSYLRLLPAGSCGELCVAGAQVGRGYLHLPDKTAEVFIANPFTQQEGYKRLYRTGDVVRILPSGNNELEFVGRRDAQVKIRGFRIELTEVEQIIRACPGVKDATVQAFDAPTGGKFIAAYVVGEEPIDIDELNAFIEARKPPYMVPEVTMQLDTIPLNANGKVDKRKLPTPVRSFADIVPPENDMQCRIFDLAAEVLGTTEFGIKTNLFKAGLTSVGIIRLNMLLAQEFDVPITIKDLRDNQTIELLEAFIAARSGGGKDDAKQGEDYPLSKNQEGIYIECISNPGSTMYNIPLLLHIDDSLDEKALCQAIATAVNAHSYLETRLFTNEQGEVRQRSYVGPAFTAADVEQVSAASLTEMKDTLVRPFDLLESCLFRISLIHADGTYLLFDVHHIIADGTSVNLFFEDVARAYEGQQISAESFTGYDVAKAEVAARAGGMFAGAKAYYDGLLSGTDTDFLLGDDVRPETSQGSGVFKRASSERRFAEVRDFCLREGVSANGLMNAVFGYVLAKYNATDYSVFTTVYNGRSDSRTARTFSMLVKTLPVCVRIARDDASDNPGRAQEITPLELAQGVSDQLLDSMVNDVYSFAEISHAYGVQGDIMFIFQGDSFSFKEFCGAPAHEVSVELSDKKMPLSLQVFCEDDRFTYAADYDNERFTEGLISAFVDAFDYALGQFTQKSSLSEVSLVSDAMLETMDAFNATEVPFDETRTIASWFEETAAIYPQNTAVVCEGRTYTYAQIERETARVAAYLQGKGIGRGEFVGVLVDRNEYMVIGAYGALRAGAAYEPLDPTYPAERLQFMLENAGARLVIADRDMSHLLEGGNLEVEILYTDQIASLPDPPSDFCSDAAPDDPYIIVYTSGTTGTPKGNVLAHRNTVALFSYHIADAQLTAESKTAYYTGFSFDAGMLDLHAALLSGGTLCIIPENLRLDLHLLDEFFCEHGITHSCMTTQMGSMFVAMTSCTTLQYFMFGGEKLVPFVPPENVVVMNGYGPSECAVYVSRYRVENDKHVQPIGTPNNNLKLYIVDPQGCRLPIGAAGELCVAGKQVGLGYLGLPEKTAEVFTPNPFTSAPGYERMYHTGDVVRELPDGNYDFVGRKDGQVKIRGFRVELTEIEQEIRQFDGIDNATVQAYDNPAGGKYIAAFVVSDTAVDFDALSDFIGQSKPSYMIPAAYMQLDAIPLTQNGKVDKRALPTPQRAAREAGEEPANATEQAFCDIFAEVLGLDKVYADDDFFSVGGSSLSAVQVVVKCDAAGYDVVFKNLFENPTPQLLAKFIHGGSVIEDVFAPTGSEKEKFDYSCLDYNVRENLRGVKYGGVGDVLLTGLTGFLGSHVYRELMESTDGKVICLIRPKENLSAEDRFQLTMTYYFEDWYNETFAARTLIVAGDLDDDNLMEVLDGVHFDTIINTAANVKHFDKAENLVRDNFESVERLIELAVSRDARLVQASSGSVCGESVNGNIPLDYRFKETDLNIGQSLDNKYVYSKYLAEQAIVDATSRGRVRGRVIRLGNLAARDSDGEFQINPSNNGTLKLLQGYIKLGCYPVDLMDAGIEFSPIDKVAEAMVLLSGVPDEYTMFHAMNCHTIHYGYIINSLNAHGHAIDVVESEEFQQRFKQALETGDDIEDYTGFVAYLNRKDDSIGDVVRHGDEETEDAAKREEQGYETRVKLSPDTTYTTKALYRLGFAWPLTSKEYLDSLIAMLDDKAFF